MSFHLTHSSVLFHQEQLLPDRLPTFAPALFESTVVLFLVGLLLGWTAIWPIALALFAVGILRPKLAIPLWIVALVLMWRLQLQPCEGAFPLGYCIALGGITLLGMGLGKFLRQVEWQLALQSVLQELTDTQVAATPETVIADTLSLVRDLAHADVAIALRQLDEVTAEVLASLPANALPDKLTSPRLFAEALEQNCCLYVSDYRAKPGAIRTLLALGTRSLVVLPLQSAVTQECRGARGAILLIWYRKIHLSPNLKRAIESLLGELRTLLQFQDATLRLETVTSRLSAILETIPQGVIFVDDSGEHSWVNPAAAEHLGLPPGEVEPSAVARAMARLRQSADNHEALCQQAAKFFSTPAADIRNWQWVFSQPQKKVLSVSSTATRVRDVPGRLWVLDDITDRYLLQQALVERSGELFQVNEELREAALQQALLYQKLALANRELENLAVKDGLTQIANRRCFDTVLAQEWQRLTRSHSPLSLILIDVDFFKRYNDTYGHQAGDECLKQIAHALRLAVKRETDLVARYGGEEFVVILPSTDSQGAVRVAEEIRLAIEEKQIEHSSSLVGEYVTLSQGIATTVPIPNSSPDELIAAADEALYQAKARGRDRSVVFDRQMQAQAAANIQLEQDLRLAIDREEFRLHYQPIVSLANGEIMGFEALVRWQHPQRGLVSPGEFIPLAETTGLIKPMSWWIFHAACCQLREWQLRFPNHPPLIMSINLSAQQLEQVGVVERLDRILQEVGISPELVKLEITETSLKETPAVLAMLKQLKTLGFKLAIDDFGTGYSSLSRLHQFPIDTLKIDRSFIAQMERDKKGLAIVQAIVVLAHHMNVKTIAEGIETISQLEHLQALQCEFGQGFLFSKPLDSQAAFELMANSAKESKLNCIVVKSCQPSREGAIGKY